MSTKTIERCCRALGIRVLALVAISLAGITQALQQPIKSTLLGAGQAPTQFSLRMTSFSRAMPGREPSASRPRRGSI